MNDEVPDFSLWLELEWERETVVLKDDGVILTEIRIYIKRADEKKWQRGSVIYFFGIEVLKHWNVFENDKEILLNALKTEEGRWVISLPTPKEDLKKLEANKVIISSYNAGTRKHFLTISMPTAAGRIERKIFRYSLPPR